MVQHSHPCPANIARSPPTTSHSSGSTTSTMGSNAAFRTLNTRRHARVSIVENAVYVPQRVAQEKGAQRAEVVKNLLESSAVAYDHYEHEIDEEIIYLGWRFDHFGHFLMQSLARTWFLTEVSPSVRVLFDPPHRGWGHPTGWVHRMLEAFGVPPERILSLNAPTRLRRLIIPEPLFEPRGIAHDHVVRAHRRWHDHIRRSRNASPADTTPVGAAALPQSPAPPAVSTNDRWGGDLEEVLRANGFRIAYTETMTFEDQVRLVNEHADIFSNTGSAAHNVLFALHEPRLHLLTNGRDFSPDYFLYLIIVGASTSFINCLNTGERPRFERAYKQTPNLLDTPKLLEYLDQRGFLTTPMPVWPSGYRTVLQARYDEAWLYGYIRAINQRHPACGCRARSVEPRVVVMAVSLALARYYARQDRQAVDSLARQFVQLRCGGDRRGPVGEVPVGGRGNGTQNCQKVQLCYCRQAA